MRRCSIYSLSLTELNTFQYSQIDCLSPSLIQSVRIGTQANNQRRSSARGNCACTSTWISLGSPGAVCMRVQLLVFEGRPRTVAAARRRLRVAKQIRSRGRTRNRLIKLVGSRKWTGTCWSDWSYSWGRRNSAAFTYYVAIRLWQQQHCQNTNSSKLRRLLARL